LDPQKKAAMHRFTKYIAVMAVVLGILALLVPLLLAWFENPLLATLSPGSKASPIEGPAPPQDDPYPSLPPLSALERLPSADTAAKWGKLQRAVMDMAQAKIRDENLPLQERSKYQDIIGETGERMLWVSMISIARDPSQDEQIRRCCIENLQGYEAYWTGRWPPPVPVGLMPEEKP
jgi:hypothetical protein